MASFKFNPFDDEEDKKDEPPSTEPESQPQSQPIEEHENALPSLNREIPKIKMPKLVEDLSDLEYKSKLEKEALKISTILNEEKVPLPEDLTFPKLEESKKERKYLKSDTTIDVIENFLRPGRTVGAFIKNAIGDVKAIKEIADTQDFNKRMQISQTRQAEHWENVKKGAALEEDVGSARDLLSDLIGKDRVEAGEAQAKQVSKTLSSVADVFDFMAGREPLAIRQAKKAKEQEEIVAKTPKEALIGKTKFKDITEPSLATAKIESELMKETPFKNLPNELKNLPFVVAAESTRALSKVIGVAPTLSYMAAETAYDPLTYVPMFAIPKFAGMAFKETMKGTLLATAKVSPKAAAAVERGINWGSEQLVNTLSKVDTKYGATKAAMKELGEQDGKSLIDSIREVHAAPKNMAEEVIVKATEGIKPERLGVIRSKLNKIVEEKGYDFKNSAVRWAVGQTPNVDALKTLSKTLQSIGDESSSILPKQFQDFTKQTLSTLSKDFVSPEETGRLFKAMDLAVSKKPKGGEIIKKADQTLDEAINYKFTDDLKEIFSDIKQGFSKEGAQIARDRREQYLETIKTNHAVMKNAVKTAETEIKELDRQRLLAINNTTKQAYKIYKQALGDFLHKRFEPRAVERAQEVLGYDMNSFVKRKVSEIEESFAKKTAGVKFGLPSLDELDSLYESAVAGAKTQFKRDLKFFSEATHKIKFLDSYNKTLAKYADVHADFFQKGIQELPEPMQKMARTFNQTMDMLASEEVARGRLGGKLPNYFPRMSRMPEGGALVFDPSEFVLDSFRAAGGSGITKHSQKRVLADFDSYRKFIEERGGRTVEDVTELLYERFLKSKKDQSRYVIDNLIPDELKVGKAGQKMSAYTNYLFNGSKGLDNYASKVWNGIKSGYQYYTKALLTVFSPAFYVRNAMGYPFIAAQGAGMRAFNPENMVDALALKSGVKHELVNDLGQKVSSKEFLEGMQQYGLINSSFTRGNIPQTINDILNRYSKADPRYWINTALHHAQHLEDTGRLMAGVTFWKQGNNLYEAARLAKSTMYDFTDFNYIDRALNGIIPFYSFTRKNIPAVMRTMYNDPKQYATLARLVDTLSTGKRPTEDQIETLNQWDRSKLMIVKDLALGKQSATYWGFTPVEGFHQDFGKMLKGKPYEWLGDLSGRLFPAAKALVHEIARNTESPAFNVETRYSYLPREYSVMSNRNVKMLNDLSQFLGWGPVEKRKRMVTEYGERFEEDGIYVAPRMYDLITLGPGARVGKEWYGLIKEFTDKEQVPEAEATVGRLVKSGAINDSEKLIRYVTGLKSDIVDWKNLDERKLSADVRKLRELGRSRGVVKTLEYIPSEIRDKFENLWRDSEFKLDMKAVEQVKRRVRGEEEGAPPPPQTPTIDESLVIP